jgi:ArsR family transcriptional regulator
MENLPRPDLNEEIKDDAYRKKVIHAFFKRGRLVWIPTQFKKQRFAMEKIAEEFEPDRSYPEREVNHILLDFHEDVATLRPSLISFKLMERKEGIYKWVTIEPRNEDMA